MPAERAVPAFRRNGKIPSCEPCRISKLRCGHERPICTRCTQRGKQCTYHPAPMTKRSSGSSPPAPSTPVSIVRTTSAPAVPNVDVPSADAPTTTTAGIARHSDGYLGGTSFFASLEESQQSIDSQGDLREEPMTVPQFDFSDERKIDAGVQVLKTLKLTQDRSMDFIERRCFMVARTPRVILERCWLSLKELLRCYCPKKAREISKMLFDNTARPLPLPGQVSMVEYADAFTGDKTRWETVGCILSAVAISQGMSDLNKKNALDRLCQPPSWKSVIDGTSQCLAFCDELRALNDLVIWLLAEHTVTTTLLFGDASYAAWKRVGDLSSCVFALGLHQQSKITPEIPRWLAELRKHSVMFAYSMDKSIAVFVGRPPRISRRYVHLDLPMVIPEEMLAAPPAELEAFIAEKGDKIWSVDEMDSPPVSFKLNKTSYILREEILELILGTSDSMSREELKSTLAGISQRSQDEWKKRPVRFRYDHTIWNSKKSPDECYGLNVMFLDHLYNDWLLQRVYVQRLHGDSQELLRLSEQMLTHGLAPVTRAGGEIGFMIADLPWSIMLFCLPAAGVLVLELLRQAQSSKASSVAFSRSSVIQNLSILISTLEWIARPGIGNYELCRQARRMLMQSLDRILDPSLLPAGKGHNSAAQTNGQPVASSTNGQALGNMDSLDVSSDPLDLLPEQWLNADPGMEFWSNLEDHSLMMFNSTDAFWPSSQRSMDTFWPSSQRSGF